MIDYQTSSNAHSTGAYARTPVQRSVSVLPMSVGTESLSVGTEEYQFALTQDADCKTTKRRRRTGRLVSVNYPALLVLVVSTLPAKAWVRGCCVRQQTSSTVSFNPERIVCLQAWAITCHGCS